jgi:uncharacterized protein (DUF302 family)
MIHQEHKYGQAVVTTLSYADAVARVKELLQEQGFGVLCEIDVAKTLRDKIGASFRPYLILGTCNPQFAHRALSEEGQLGLLLPCNVVIQEQDGRVVVSTVDAHAMLGIVDNASLKSVADEVNERFAHVRESLPAAYDAKRPS